MKGADNLKRGPNQKGHPGGGRGADRTMLKERTSLGG